MADEAVLRIMIQGEGGTTPLAPPPAKPEGDASVVPVPTKEAKKGEEAAKKPRKEEETEKPVVAMPVFDPHEEARKRREGERRGARINEAYKQQYGDPNQESGMDRLLKVVGQFRGVIGGLTGATFGAALDIMASFQRNRAESARRQHEQRLLREPLTDKDAPGPINAVVAGVKSAATAVTKAGASGATAAGTEAVGGLASGGAAAAGGMGAAVPIVGAFVAVIGLAVAAVKAFIDAIDERVERYGEYSPVIAQAQAIAEVNKTMNDMRRAQQYGGELARYVRVRAQMEEKWEEIKMKFFMAILPILNGIMKTANAIYSVLPWSKPMEGPLPPDPTSALFEDDPNKGGVIVPQL